MSSMRYFVNLLTGALNSAPKGSSFDRERTQSSEYRGFDSEADRRKYIQQMQKKNR